FGIQENISCPWASISSAVVFRSAKTSIETPASPTRGEIDCTIFLHSSFCSCVVIRWPDASNCCTSGFFAIRLGFVVCPSTKPRSFLIRRVSLGSPPSTRIFVFGLAVRIVTSPSRVPVDRPSWLRGGQSVPCLYDVSLSENGSWY